METSDRDIQRSTRRDAGDRQLANALDPAVERLADLAHAAERAAIEIGDRFGGEIERRDVDLERPSRARLVAELGDALTRRVSALAEEATSLAAILERASARLTANGASSDAGQRRVSSPSDAEAVASAEPPVLGSPQPPVRRKRFGRRRGSLAQHRPSDGVRLLATQMAIAGSDRDEIGTRLREDFGVELADAVLDEILAGRLTSRRPTEGSDPAASSH